MIRRVSQNLRRYWLHALPNVDGIRCQLPSPSGRGIEGEGERVQFLQGSRVTAPLSAGAPAFLFTATVGTGFEPFFQDTLRAFTTDWRENLLPVIIAAAVVTLAVAVVVWLRRVRRGKGPQLHRSAWPARASRNQPNDTPLVATRTFRQRRRRRRRSRPSQ